MAVPSSVQSSIGPVSVAWHTSRSILPTLEESKNRGDTILELKTQIEEKDKHAAMMHLELTAFEESECQQQAAE